MARALYRYGANRSTECALAVHCSGWVAGYRDRCAP
jgi:hypothetical protein